MSLDVAALYAAERDRVFHYLRKRLGGRDLSVADDLTADVFLRAWQHRDRYVERPGIPPGAWLVRIAHNLLVDYLRRERRSLSLDGLHVAAPEPAPDRRELVAALPAALARLTERQRAVIVERFYLGARQRELGHIATYHGVKKLQQRALVNLRRALEVA